MRHAGAGPAAGRGPAAPDAVPVRGRSRSSSCVITAVEIGVSYLEGDIPDGLHRRAAARHGGREVLPGRVVVHAPAHRPADLPALLRRGRRRGARSLYLVVLAHAARSSTEPAPLMPRPSAFPRWAPHPDVWLLVAAVRGRVRDRRRPPRPAARRAAGSRSSPDSRSICFVARACSRCGSPPTGRPRHRRALQLQRPHGAAPPVLDGRGAAAAPRARPAWLLRLDPAPAALVFRTVRVAVAVPARR